MYGICDSRTEPASEPGVDASAAASTQMHKLSTDRDTMPVDNSLATSLPLR